jgi:peptide/nickel transport system permease protein
VGVRVLRTIGVKLVTLIPVLFLVSLGTFFLVDLIPGHPEVQVLGSNAAPDDYIRVRHELGLDQPVLERYGNWLGDVFTGDFGKSLLPPVEGVRGKLARALPVSLELAAMAMVIALLLSVPVALMSAYRPGQRFDRVVTTATFATISLPSFLAGLVLILFLGLKWGVFPDHLWVRPTEDFGQNLNHAILPAFTIALPEAAIYARLLRTDLVSTLQDDFILAARAKGMPARHIMMREALRPSSFSLVTLAGVSVGRLIGGTIIVERLFALPGVGTLIVESANRKDVKVVQAGVLLIAVIYVLMNALVDVLYGVLDPRIRRGRV